VWAWPSLAALILLEASPAPAPSGLPLLLPPRGFEARPQDHTLKMPGVQAAALRADALVRARIWMQPETAIERADLRHTPRAEVPVPDEAVCRFFFKKTNGSTQKFFCVFRGGEVMKVKYGRDAEIQTEVAATRLFRALGAGANEMYYVKKLRCFGCPKEPDALLRCVSSRSAEVRRECAPIYGERTPAGGFQVRLDYGRYVDFTNVSVQHWFPGKTIRTDRVDGWGWDELDRLQSGSGGASRAERDALRLLAVFLNDWDNSADNQRLVCLSGGEQDGGGCSRPFAYVDDLGGTFGGIPKIWTRTESAPDVEGWRAVPVWKDAASCRVSLRSPALHHATFKDAEISESGRRFLADRLRRLSPAQIRGLFEAAGFGDLEGASEQSRDLGRWVSAFEGKAREIVEAGPCPTP